MMNNGIIYCLAGNRTHAEAIAISLFSLPDTVPALILCDGLRHADFLSNLLRDRAGVEIRAVDVPLELVGYQRSRYLKIVAAVREASWQSCLYLDSDTLALPGFQWPALDGEVGMLFDYQVEGRPLSEAERIYTDTLYPGNDFAYFQFNGGLVLWEAGAAAQRFFEAWWAEYERFGGPDQLALMRSLWVNKIRVCDLPVSLNLPQNLLSAESRAVFAPQLIHCLGGQIESGQFKIAAQALAPKALERFQEAL